MLEPLLILLLDYRFARQQRIRDDSAQLGQKLALKASLEAKTLAEDSLGIARRQLQLGDISYLALLSAEQAYQQSVIALVQAQANRYADTAALFQALGGGWWNRPRD